MPIKERIMPWFPKWPQLGFLPFVPRSLQQCGLYSITAGERVKKEKDAGVGGSSLQLETRCVPAWGLPFHRLPASPLLSITSLPCWPLRAWPLEENELGSRLLQDCG